MTTGGPNPRPVLRVTEIGEFVRFNSCLRRAKLGFSNRALARELPFYARLENSLDVVLQEKGEGMERAWERDLTAMGLRSIGHGTREVPFTLDVCMATLAGATTGDRIYAREVSLRGRIGAFDVEGRFDFLLVLWRDDLPYIRIVEGKASRRDRTYQRMQVAAYVYMLRAWVEQNGLEIAGHRIRQDNIEGVVARIDDDTRRPQDLQALEALDLSAPIDDLLRLLGRTGPFERAFASDVTALPYALEPKCDACVFSVHCFPESARQRRLELAGMTSGTVAALKASGLDSLDAVAELDLEGTTAEALRSNEALDEEIERLSARARVRRKKLPDGHRCAAH